MHVLVPIPCVSFSSMLPLEVPEGLKVTCVVGFSFGGRKPNVKCFTKQTSILRVDEIDMVINIALAKEGKFDQAQDEIRATVRRSPQVLKVTESAALTDA